MLSVDAGYEPNIIKNSYTEREINLGVTDPREKICGKLLICRPASYNL